MSDQTANSPDAPGSERALISSDPPGSKKAPISPGRPGGGRRASGRAAAGLWPAGRARWLPLACIGLAAALASLTALWVSRSMTGEARDGLEITTAATRDEKPPLSDAQRREAAQRARFTAVRDALLALDPSRLPGLASERDRAGLSARVWTLPDPVENDAIYRVGIEADCACSALLFSVSATSDEIALLYPNLFQINSRLEAGAPVEVPSTPEWTLRAVGGEGVDVLELLIFSEPPAFPSDRSSSWLAAPDRPDRIAELEALLEALQTGEWGVATTTLRIVSSAVGNAAPLREPL